MRIQYKIAGPGRRTEHRLRHALEAIARIQRYAARGRQTFEADELVQSWIVRHLQIVGEVARALPESVRARAPEVPWAKIIGMRHILVHDYFGIDTDIVWDVGPGAHPPGRGPGVRCRESPCLEVASAGAP